MCPSGHAVMWSVPPKGHVPQTCGLGQTGSGRGGRAAYLGQPVDTAEIPQEKPTKGKSGPAPGRPGSLRKAFFKLSGKGTHAAATRAITEVRALCRAGPSQPPGQADFKLGLPSRPSVPPATAAQTSQCPCPGHSAVCLPVCSGTNFKWQSICDMDPSTQKVHFWSFWGTCYVSKHYHEPSYQTHSTEHARFQQNQPPGRLLGARARPGSNAQAAGTSCCQCSADLIRRLFS